MKKLKLLFASAFMLTTLCAFAQNNTTDEGVEINGIIWATRNVDAPGTFAENPEDAGMFYQWNRRVGWSSTDPMVNSDGGTTWDTTMPEEGASWEKENDPCPQGWRVPTLEELQYLRNYNSIWTAQNDVNGQLFGTYPNQIFLPATGWRRNTTGKLDGVGAWGVYWSGTQDGSLRAWSLDFSNDSAGVNSDWRDDAFSIRCVKAENQTSINNILTENNRTPIAFYTITGVKLGQKPQSGIFIILYCDGSAEKLMR